MAQDKYIIRPYKTIADTIAGLGIGQSCLVSDGTEAANKHVHRIGNGIFVPAHCRWYNMDTSTWAWATEDFGTIHVNVQLNVGATSMVQISEDVSGGRILANLPEYAAYATLATGELYYCAADANRVYQK